MALFDTQLAMLANQASNALISGKDPPRQGNTHPNIVPYQPFEAADQPIIIAVGNDRQFARLAEMCGHPEWASDERFATNGARVANREAIVAAGQRLHSAQARGANGWSSSKRRASRPGRSTDVRQALEDVQAQHRGMVRTIAGVPLIGSPIRIDDRAGGFGPPAAGARGAYGRGPGQPRTGAAGARAAPVRRRRRLAYFALLALSTSRSSWFWQPFSISTCAAPTRSVGGFGTVTKVMLLLSPDPAHSI